MAMGFCPETRSFSNSTYAVIVVNVKINGDYNRNGNPADDPHKADPVTFAGPKGFVILANNNDSDGDGEPDCDSVSGQYTIRNNDLSDIYQICIPKLGIPVNAIPSGMTVSVQVLHPSNDTASFDAIIFSAIAISAVGDAELDFSTPATVGQTFGGTGTTIFGIEGRTPGNEVRVRLTVKLNGNVLGTDEIRLLVAPFRVLDNTATASKVYVANAAPVQYWQQFYDDATNALNSVVAVEEYGSTFIQDSGEIGAMQSAPGQATRKQCTIMGLQGASYQGMISTNIGYFFMDCSDTKGGGGNIEAAPPVQNFPYGRLVVGSTLQSNAKVFLKAQKIQTDNGNLIELPTDWLQTGHVDEVMTFVPVGSGFKVLVADLQLAIDLLRTNQTSETEGGFATRAQILATYDANSNRVAAINSYLATVRANLAQGLGLNQNDFIRVPVPFTVVANQAQTVLPNMMNMIVVKNAASTRRILMPEPYFDPFFNDIGVKLTNLGYQSSEIFTADTRGPHGGGGEAHCASNVRREVP